MKRALPVLVAIVAVALGAWLLWPRDSDAPRQETPAPEVARDDVSPRTGDAPALDDPAAPKWTVYVEVTDESHAPVAGARVAITGPGLSLEGTTDQTGVATFEEVRGRPVSIALDATGFETVRQAVPPLSPDTPAVSWSYALPRTAAKDAPPGVTLVTGAVLSEGRPVPDATVLVEREGMKAFDPSELTLTDAGGRFSFSLRGPTPIRVRAFSAAHGEGSVDYGGEREVVVTLPPGGRIEGEVRGPGGAPLEAFYLRATPRFDDGAGLLRLASRSLRRLSRRERRQPQVRALRGQLRSLMRGVEVRAPDAGADANGAFALGPFAPGTVHLVASSEGLEPAALDVEVRSGATTSDVVLRLYGPVVVSGVVTDAKTGAPISGARVRALSLEDADVPGFALATTDAEGRYRLLTRADVRHRLRADKRGYRPFDVGGVEGRSGDELVRDFQLTPERRRRRGRTPREYVGIGAQLRKNDDGVVILKTFEGGAAKGSLEHGDVVLRVDGAWVEDLSLRETVEAILGEEETEVELLVKRAGGDTETVYLERRRVTTGG